MSPYNQGYYYHLEGGRFNDNPYYEYSTEWYDWNEGYRDAPGPYGLDLDYEDEGWL